MQQLEFFEVLDKPTSVCPYCKKIFEKSKIRANNIYCSRSCKNEQYEFLRKENVKNRTPIGFCIACNKVFKKNSSSHKYCSEQCHEPYKRKIQRMGAKKYRIKNIEKVLKREKKYRAKNKESIKERLKLYRIKNKEKIKERQKLYNIQNREKRLESYRIYHSKNKEKARLYRIQTKERTRKQARERWKKDIQYRLRSYMRSRIRCALKPQNAVKSNKASELLGCSLQEAMNHIQSQFKEGMSWDNYGFYGWHIDHIIPCSSFDLTDPEQQKKCFHYTNLQPLWCYENFSKGSKILKN